MYVPPKYMLRSSQEYPSTNGNYWYSIDCSKCGNPIYYLGSCDIHNCRSIDVDCEFTEIQDLAIRVAAKYGKK